MVEVRSCRTLAILRVTDGNARGQITEVRVNNIQGLAEAITQNLLVGAGAGGAGLAVKQQPPLS